MTLAFLPSSSGNGSALLPNTDSATFRNSSWSFRVGVLNAAIGEPGSCRCSKRALRLGVVGLSVSLISLADCFCSNAVNLDVASWTMSDNVCEMSNCEVAASAS